MYEKEGIRSIYKNAIYVQREGTSFEILAGYSVYYGNCNDVSISGPDVTPPLHHFTHSEKRRIEEGIVESMESQKELE